MPWEDGGGKPSWQGTEFGASIHQVLGTWAGSPNDWVVPMAVTHVAPVNCLNVQRVNGLG